MSLHEKLPSLDRLVYGAATAVKRFPLTLTAAALATLSVIQLADHPSSTDQEMWQRLALACSLAVPFLFALAVFGEKRWGKSMLSRVPSLVGLVLIVWYYLTLPVGLEPEYQHLLRFAILMAGAHFLVACLPYLDRTGKTDFWHYNKSLFLRFLLAALYSAVLFVGLAIALAAADHLFGFDVKEIRYVQLWMLMAGLTNTWIFLAGVPERLDNIGTDEDYPKGLSLFAQFVLLPLVALYFVILIAYEAKIVIQWNWPRGWVSQLVLWYAVVGILALLLLYPLRNKEGKRWVQVFSRSFFWALVPLLGMLFFAIAVRISDYGLTEPRYLVVAMAVGLTAVMLYFLFSKGKDIRIIPTVLTVVALVSAFGPWGAFAVSRNDQQDRLQELLVNNELFADGHLIEPVAKLPSDVCAEMSSVVQYLYDYHGVKAFERWFSESELAAVSDTAKYYRATMLTAMFGFEYAAQWQRDIDRVWSPVTPYRESVDVEGYSLLIALDGLSPQGAAKNVVVGEHNFSFVLDSESGTMEVWDYVNELHESIPLAEKMAEALESYPATVVPAGELEFTFALSGVEAKVVLKTVTGYKTTDGYKVTNAEGWLLFK